MRNQKNDKVSRYAAEVDALFAAYRTACPEPEPGTDFMPKIWEKIEARQTSAYNLRRLAQGFVTAAAAASLLMGLFLASPSGAASGTYLEALAADQGSDSEETEMVQPELDAYDRTL